MSTDKKLTTAAGAPVVDNQNTQTAGPRGPALLQRPTRHSGAQRMNLRMYSAPSPTDSKCRRACSIRVNTSA